MKSNSNNRGKKSDQNQATKQLKTCTQLYSSILIFQISFYLILYNRFKHLLISISMGRKRRDMSCLKPFCFYCQKQFKNQVILHHHQKAKHFHCPKCPKKFASIDSMIEHARGSHNVNVERVPNANSGKDNIGLKIFGMQGVPRLQIQNWISKNVGRYWGRILQRKQKKRLRQQQQRLEKEKKEREQRNEQEQNNNDGMEEEKNQEPQQNLDFPLEFNIPQN